MAVDVLVTGATGVLGGRVVAALKQTGRKVVACGRTHGPTVDAVWDLSSDAAPIPDCRPTVVVHCAAAKGPFGLPLDEGASCFAVNVLGGVRLAQWCVSQAVAHLVVVSGAIVYGQWLDAPKRESDPVSPAAAGSYALSKWCSEQVIAATVGDHSRLTVLRLSSLYDANYRDHLFERMLKEGRATGQVLVRQPVDDGFDFLAVSDAARTIANVVDRGAGGLWNVGGGGLTTIHQAAVACAAEVGAQLLLAPDRASRPRRILNWVDDRRSRLDVGHQNLASLPSVLSQINIALTESGQS